MRIYGGQQARLVEDDTRVVAPTIDDIDYRTFEYKLVVLPQLGVFDWARPATARVQ